MWSAAQPCGARRSRRSASATAARRWRCCPSTTRRSCSPRSTCWRWSSGARPARPAATRPAGSRPTSAAWSATPLAFLAGGHADAVDGVLFPHTCDSIQQLATLTTDLGGWKKPAFTFLHPRGADRPSARRFVEAELRRLAGTLERFTGHTLTDERLAAALAAPRRGRRGAGGAARRPRPARPRRHPALRPAPARRVALAGRSPGGAPGRAGDAGRPPGAARPSGAGDRLRARAGGAARHPRRRRRLRGRRRLRRRRAARRPRAAAPGRRPLAGAGRPLLRRAALPDPRRRHRPPHGAPRRAGGAERRRGRARPRAQVLRAGALRRPGHPADLRRATVCRCWCSRASSRGSSPARR